MRPQYFDLYAPTQAAAYQAGDVVGGLLSIPNGPGTGQWVLKNLYVVDRANQGAQLLVHFFRSMPAGTYTDGAALNWDDADLDLLVCSVEVLAATYKTQDSIAIANTAYSVGGVNLVPRQPVDGQNIPKIWVVMTTTGTPTYGEGTDILRVSGCFIEDKR